MANAPETSTAPDRIDVLASNLSNPALVAIGSVDLYQNYLESIGADGLELTPVNPMTPFMRRLLGRAYLIQSPDPEDDYLPPGDIYEDEALRDMIRSLHSSFREQDHDNGPFARLFPRWKNSLGYMRSIQYLTGPLPAVLYPNFEDGQVVYDDIVAPFADRTFQPKKLDWKLWDLTEGSSIEDIEAAMRAHGFDGVTYDVFHALSFKDPAALAAKLTAAGLVKAVHLSLYRTDITGRGSEAAQATRGASQAFASSAALARSTPEGEILGIIAAGWKKQPAEPGSLRRRLVIEEGPLSPPFKKRRQAATINNAKELMDNA